MTELEKSRLQMFMNLLLSQVYDWYLEDDLEEGYEGFLLLNEEKWNEAITMIQSILDDNNLIYKIEVLKEEGNF